MYKAGQGMSEKYSTGNETFSRYERKGEGITCAVKKLAFWEWNEARQNMRRKADFLTKTNYLFRRKRIFFLTQTCSLTTSISKSSTPIKNAGVTQNELTKGHGQNHPFVNH